VTVNETRLVDATVKQLKLLQADILDPDKPETLDLYKVRQDEIMSGLALVLPESKRSGILNKLQDNMLEILSGNANQLLSLYRMSRTNKPLEESIQEYLRLPSTSDEDKKNMLSYLETLNNIREGK
jgi:hypothetical protein